MKTEFPAHLLLTPSGGQTGSPAAARRGRGAAVRQMAAFTYSWGPRRRGRLGPEAVPPRRGVCKGGFVFGRGAHTLRMYTHTEVHKEPRIFIVPTHGCTRGLPTPPVFSRTDARLFTADTDPTTHTRPPRATCTDHKVRGSCDSTPWARISQIYSFTRTEKHPQRLRTPPKSHSPEVTYTSVLLCRCTPVHTTTESQNYLQPHSLNHTQFEAHVEPHRLRHTLTKSRTASSQ